MKTKKRLFTSKTYKILTQVLITPDVATYILEHQNFDNPRDLHEFTAARIAKDIKKDKFLRKIGALIVFLQDGRLIDGQTRLRAIVLSGIPVKVDIAVGVESKDALYIGTQRAFNMGVVFANALGLGKAFVQKMRAVHAVSLLYMRYLASWSNEPLPLEERYEFYQTHKRHIEPFIEGVTNADSNRVGVRAAFAFYHSINPQQATRLWPQVTGSVDKVKHAYVITLRAYLAESKYKFHPMRRQVEDFRTTLALFHAIEKKEAFTVESRLNLWV